MQPHDIGHAAQDKQDDKADDQRINHHHLGRKERCVAKEAKGDHHHDAANRRHTKSPKFAQRMNVVLTVV